MAEEKVVGAPVIAIDDGTEAVEIVNKRGDVIGKLVFRPSDMGIVARWNAMAGNFDHITEPLTALDEKTATPEDRLAAIEQAKERLCAALDEAFDGNVSEAFFAGVHPFALVGGRFYAEIVMDAVAGYMSKRFTEEFKRVHAKNSDKTGKYASAIRKGPPNGSGK